MTKERKVSVSRTIEAPPSVIFDILADPSRHAEIDGSSTVQRSTSESRRLALGDRFGMKMKLGPLPYGISSTVVEFEEDRLIAWAHLGKHRWRYELEPVDGGTLVTETFDWSTSLAPWAIEAAGYPRRHPEAMARTLELTKGLIVAEAVMMGLAPRLGRQRAHDAVYQCCRAALTTDVSFVDALLAEPDIGAQFDRAEIEALTAPRAYLGSAPEMTRQFLDRRWAR